MRSDCILFEVTARMFQAEAHIGVSRQMPDHIGAFHRVCQKFRIEKISTQQFEIGVFRQRLSETDLACGKIVAAYYPVSGVKKPGAQITPYEASPSGDKRSPHGIRSRAL
jgi:hypothetical protein